MLAANAYGTKDSNDGGGVVAVGAARWLLGGGAVDGGSGLFVGGLSFALSLSLCFSLLLPITAVAVWSAVRGGGRGWGDACGQLLTKQRHLCRHCP